MSSSPSSSSPSRRSSGDDIAAMHPKLRNLYQAPKPEININLDKKQTTYSTLDELKGEVEITAQTDTSFDKISIEFVGTSRTYVERLTTAAAISGRSEAFHQFLKLEQPHLQEHYPEDCILQAKKTYRFPFVFNIPGQLLPRICQHKAPPALRDAHLQLPPSFGDRDAADKDDKLEDMVPDMASVRYGVFARIIKTKFEGDEIKKNTIASKARRLRVIPTTEEQPPLDIGGPDSEYIMRKERTVRKGVLKSKTGTLVMESAQPPVMRLRSGSNAEQQPSMATIMLRFDPVDEKSSPPRLSCMDSKLKVCTYFASTARNNYPTKQAALLDLSQGMHSEQLNLSSRCMANVEWTKHDPSQLETTGRRDSAYSVASFKNAGVVPEPSAAFKKGKPFWTAQLLVPIVLPTHKSFVPTFHSCLISRIYQLKLELGLATGGIGGSVDLKVPFQIIGESSDGEASSRRGSESALEMQTDDDVTDFFEARTLRVPSDEYVGRSRLRSQVPINGEAPPGYSAFSPTPSRVPVY